MKEFILSILAALMLFGGVGTPSVQANQVGATGRIIHNGTNLRATPVNGTVLGSLDSWDQVRLNSWARQSDGWIWDNVNVQTGRNAGRRGWVRADLIVYGVLV